MNNQPIRTYKIYALLLRDEDVYVYIGKSAGERLSVVYHRHWRGEIAATKTYLVQEKEPPALYLLEECLLTSTQAKQRVLAWSAVFDDEGYILLNKESFDIKEDSLSADVRALIETIGRQPLEDVLQHTCLERPADRDNKPAYRPGNRAEKTKTLTVRLTPAEKKRLQAFCARTGLTQSEAFTVLLDRTTEAADTQHLDRIFAKKRTDQKPAEGNRQSTHRTN